jgi:hypothetical protein
MKKLVIVPLSFALSLAIIPPASAGLSGKAVREAAEFLMKKFGKEVAEEGAEKLTGRIAASAARHGDDVLAAVRKVGPKALSLADEAGEHAPRVMRLLSRHGDDAARVFSRPKAMGLLARYGDDAAEALIKHDGIAEAVVERLGEPALKALGALGDRGGRRLAMMAKGELASIGRTRELLGVIARHGDPAMDFVWRHKAVLAGGMALTAFLANPEPYLNGTAHLAGTVGENVIKPVVVAAGNVAAEAAGFLRWTVTILVCGIAAGLFVAVRNGALEKPWVRAAAQAAGESLSKHSAGLFGRK